MSFNHVVVIGTSAGGFEALKAIVAGLPDGFPAPVCVVMHTSPDSPGVLAAMLGRAGVLPCVSPSAGERVKAGTVYVAPPDFHLVLEPGIVRLTKGPKENRFRPAIDPLFRSAAQVYGPAAIGVVLTGNLDDGTAGLWALKQLGGTTIVQDPDDALFPGMPRNALEHVRADHIVPLREIAPLLVKITAPTELIPEVVAHATPSHINVEIEIAKEKNSMQAGLKDVTVPSPYACPDCHGVLLQLTESDRIRFRCHTGHAYSLASLAQAIADDVEASLWSAVRAADEGARLLDDVARHVGGNDVEQYRAVAAEARRRSELLRGVLMLRN